MIVKYLEGLNGLRFLAAFLVLVAHGYQTLEKLGFARHMDSTVILYRARSAVDFFFTLSGFLIMYLLLRERASTSTVSLKKFYIRRMCRIWPLYFMIVFLGFILLGVLYPLVYHSPYLDFSLGTGLLLYTCFLPNWMASFYRTGLMNPLWSIGVEEQFYLCWAPLVKGIGRHVAPLVTGFILLTAAFQAIMVESPWFPMAPELRVFLATLRFHYMAVGTLFAVILFHAGKRYRESFFAGYAFQLLIVLLLLYHFFIGFPIPKSVLLDVPLAFCFGALILSVSVAPRRLINLEWEPLVYLGKISYGIYMYHMTADYILRMLLEKLHLAVGVSGSLVAAYCGTLAVVTLLLAHLSYRYFESRFFALGHRVPAKGEAA